MYLIFWDNKILLDVCLPSISTHKKHFNINYLKTRYYSFYAEYVHNCFHKYVTSQVIGPFSYIHKPLGSKKLIEDCFKR